MKINPSVVLETWAKNSGIEDELTFKPISLGAVERLLIGKFETKQEVLNKIHRVFLLGSLFYIGEVFKRNDRIRNLKWVSEAGRMPILSCNYYSNSWIDIFQKLPNVIHKRSGNVFLQFYEKNITYFKTNHVRLKKLNVEVPGTETMKYEHRILDDNSLLDLNLIKNYIEEKVFEKYDVATIYYHNESHLVYDLNNNYHFHFILKPYQDTSGNQKIISFHGDDDQSGEFMNKSLFILEGLEREFKFMKIETVNN